MSAIFWVITLLYAGFIFILSSSPLAQQPATIKKTEDIANTTVSGIVKTIAPSAPSLEPREMYSIQHILLYIGLGFFLYVALFTMRSDYIRENAFIIAGYLGYAYGVSDEIHQYFVPTRTCLLETTFLNGLGVLSGIAIAVMLIWLSKKISRWLRHS